jgi:cytochrome c-type biogenesis protein
MSTQISAKKSLIFAAFIMFSLIFVGGIFVATNEIAIGADQELSYPSWLIISYLAGLSMIILPCTLPLVFIIITLCMGKGGKMGLTMGLLFAAGLTITISL